MKQVDLEKLIEQHTRAEIMARFGPVYSDVDYFQIKLELMDRIRKKLFGSSDFIVLAHKFGLLKPRKHKKKSKIKIKIKMKTFKK